jgi:hypothetical protein
MVALAQATRAKADSSETLLQLPQESVRSENVEPELDHMLVGSSRTARTVQTWQRQEDDKLGPYRHSGRQPSEPEFS